MKEKKYITAERATTELLRSIKAGKSVTLKLPDAKACRNAAVQAYKTAPILECKFKISTNYKAREVTITRLKPTP